MRHYDAHDLERCDRLIDKACNEILKQQTIIDQLTDLGTPIWDGKTRISIRGATLDEITSYASRSSEADAEGELGIVYIVTLDSKT